MKEAILTVSFGTTVESARINQIGGVEQAVAAAFPEKPLYSAYTSPTIRRILAGRGVIIPSLTEALEAQVAMGTERLYVLLTHLLTGIEYDRIVGEIERYRPNFTELVLAPPLMGDTHGVRKVADILMERFECGDDHAYVLLGHGTDHPANLVYPALQGILHMGGRRDILIGTVEGWPAQGEVLDQLDELGVTHVTLAPLMLVCGDHAHNDMAGEEPDSWNSVLSRAGHQVCCAMEGLGDSQAIRNLYCERLKGAINP